MALEAILDEVDQLHNVSTRLEGLSDQHPSVSEALLTTAGNVRSTATVLAVLVATELRQRRWKRFLHFSVACERPFGCLCG